MTRGLLKEVSSVSSRQSTGVKESSLPLPHNSFNLKREEIGVGECELKSLSFHFNLWLSTRPFSEGSGWSAQSISLFLQSV